MELVARLHVPDPGCVVPGSSHQSVTVWAEGRRHNAVGMAAKDAQLLARRHVPQPYRPVGEEDALAIGVVSCDDGLVRGGQPPAIGTELHGVEPQPGHLQGPQYTSAGDIPYASRFVVCAHAALAGPEEPLGG